VLAAAFDGPVAMSSMPDVAPTLMMVAPFLRQPTRITGLATLRVKECDRIAAPTRELRKLGIEVEEGPDFMVIQPLRAQPTPKVVEIETYHDHRIAMSFGVLGSRLPGLRILDPGCVAKTYPNYWRDWQRARAVARGV
jgi:3-phosphoshikimate 1-carboxyvinyltransferase